MLLRTVGSIAADRELRACRCIAPVLARQSRRNRRAQVHCMRGCEEPCFLLRIGIRSGAGSVVAALHISGPKRSGSMTRLAAKSPNGEAGMNGTLEHPGTVSQRTASKPVARRQRRLAHRCTNLVSLPAWLLLAMGGALLAGCSGSDYDAPPPMS